MAVHLTRIYTRTGDDGTTALGDMSRVRKTDPRLAAYADVDEANAAIGVALALGAARPTDVVAVLRSGPERPVRRRRRPVHPGHAPNPSTRRCGSSTRYVDRLEAACDELNERLDKLRSFILPGGTPGAALLHVARTVVRRAERSAWARSRPHADTMNPLPARYLNRLSDLLFILARVANPDAATCCGCRARTAEPDLIWLGLSHVTDAAGGAGGTGVVDDRPFQPFRMRAFCCSNSAWVSKPADSSSPSSFSRATRSAMLAAGPGAGPALAPALPLPLPLPLAAGHGAGLHRPGPRTAAVAVQAPEPRSRGPVRPIAAADGAEPGRARNWPPQQWQRSSAGPR